jgi:hypothetical protein
MWSQTGNLSGFFGRLETEYRTVEWMCVTFLAPSTTPEAACEHFEFVDSEVLSEGT